MKDDERYRIVPVTRAQHLTSTFLEFSFFWNSENGKAIIFGNPRLLMPIIAIPYMFASEIYDHEGRRYFAKMGDQIVAVLTLIRRPDSIIVRSLAVSPRHRRLGIGLFILNRIENLCRQMKADWLELTVLRANTPALRLYEKFGFTKVAERKFSLLLRKRI